MEKNIKSESQSPSYLISMEQQLVLIALFMNLNLSDYMSKSHYESETNSKVFQTEYISPYGG